MGMRYSALFLLCCTLLWGCSPRKLTSDAAHHRAAGQTAELQRRYGELHDRGAELYVRMIVERLVQNHPQPAVASARYRIVLLNTLEPVAAAPGNSTVILSRGLLLQLSNEAELAFILAHELGHEILGHTLEVDRSPETRQTFELAADRFGLGLVALAGYDPRPAVQALAHLQRTNDLWSTDPNYPDFVHRLAGLQTAIHTSHWQPPGTVDRRDFRKLHAVLCEYPPRAAGGVCG
jgi:predicted Zn-dependent protease